MRGKRYQERLAHLEAAGELSIPFTTGILFGIGETEHDRRRALELIRDCHGRHHQIQEVIIQNFIPKPNTPIAAQPGPDPATAAVELARAILPSDAAVQVPPNLNFESWPALVQAGVADLGGSPRTGNPVSPAFEWPSEGGWQPRPGPSATTGRSWSATPSRLSSIATSAWEAAPSAVLGGACSTPRAPTSMTKAR